MEQRPLDLIRDGDRIVGVKLLTDMDYEQAFKELAVTLLRKEAIRLRCDSEAIEKRMEHISISLGGYRRGLQQPVEWYELRDRMHDNLDEARELESKIDKFIETGEWEQTLKEAVIE